ncbi:MAG: hypothetical protein OEV49_15095 [candidate division Zixibacteria bacterium]|nr:hypothetical protein [candidate division Zixibacteria bacterium]MDH3936064.1 hypothetical protein [candidate division Zixibacteria bacterium]MDH4033548.1 hypothetical protein [candidate division Zixibacteria bacterium]
MTSFQRAMLVFCGAVLVRLAFHLFTGFTGDDAFITFRYAENLAAGSGFVYNSGQQVLGTSSPMFALLLAAFSLAGLKPPFAALMVSLASSGVTAVVVYQLALHIGFKQFAWTPTLLYILFPRSVSAESCGMETALFTTLVISAIYLFRTSRYTWSLVLASLAIVTRPEGCFALLIIIVAITYKERGVSWRRLLPPVLIVSPWLIFSELYFGSVVPHSIPAKLALYNRIGVDSGWERVVFLMAWHNPFGWVLTGLVVAGCIYLMRKHQTGLLEIAWSFGLILFYALSPTHLFFWYVAPIYPVYLILASCPLLSPRLQGSGTDSSTGKVVIYACTCLALLMLFASCRTAVSYKAQQEVLDSVHRAIGGYLRKNADAADLVAAEDIGYIGYYSRLRILDRDGLVSPEAVAYNRRGEYGELISSVRPEWVVAGLESPISAFTADSSFLRNYVLSASFSERSIEYSVFRLVE